MRQVLDAWSMAIGVAWAWWGAEGHPTLRLHKDSYPMAAGTEIRLEGWPKAI